MNNKLGIMGVAIASLAISACGGGGSSSGSTAKTGVLVDAPVGGVRYTTDSNTEGSFTNARGEFTFKPGETVTFTIGGIDLGQPVLADAIITPLELLGANAINDEVVNLAQLLQSLDSDDDPNTITISETTREALSGQVVAFDNVDFDADVQALFDAIPALGTITLVSDDDAQNHLEDTFEDFANASADGFTTIELADNSFYFLGRIADLNTVDEAESTYFAEFDADGTGSIEQIESSGGNDITWFRKIDGRLTYHEEDSSSNDYWDLVITPTDRTEDGILVDWTETGMEDGKAVSNSGTGLFYTENRYPAYSIDLTTKVASSVVTMSTCASYSADAGFDYSFTDTVMTRIGTDEIDDETSACVTGESEIQTFTVGDLASDFDIPFNCDAFPICAYDDLNKTIIDSSEGQTTEATYVHVPGSNTITYSVTYQPANFTIDEILTLSAAPLSSPVAFTEQELQDFTFYFALREPEDCGDSWVVEEMSFDAQGYSLDVCGEGLGQEDNQAYQLLASGIVYIPGHEEFVNRMSFDEERNAYLVCWEDSAEAASDCPVESQGLAFLDLADAEAYQATQNGDVNPTEFSDAELTDNEFFNVFVDSDCGEWVLESFSFDGANYTLGATCEGGTPETDTYSVLESGVLYINRFGDYIRKVSFDESIGAYRTCWSDSLDGTSDCSAQDLDYMFIDESDAQAFADEQNETGTDPLAYTQDALQNSTLYDVWENDEGCSPVWVLETFIFATSTYSVGICNPEGGFTSEQGTFEVLASGVLRLIESGDYIRRTSYNAEIDGYKTCWENSEAEALACQDTGGDYQFSDLSKAEAYQTAQNADAVPDVFTTEWLANRTVYDVWFGIEDGFVGDDARVASIAFNSVADTASWFGIAESNIDLSVAATVDSAGKLYFGTDEGNRFEINSCGNTADYLEIIYTENGNLDNIDRFYFTEEKALAYVATLSGSIPQTVCP